MRRAAALGTLACLFFGCASDEGRTSASSGADELDTGLDADADADASAGSTSESAGESSGSETADTMDDATQTSTATASESESGPKFDLGSQDAMLFEPIPVKDLPGLESITFYERTGGSEPTSYTFTVDGPELTVALADPLALGNFDIPGASGEFYDVYYSDEGGVFALDGSYLTISGTFSQTLPAGGGLNLAEIGLNFTDANTEFGNYVASFVALGDNAHPESVPNCIDGDLQTHTTMGNTVGQTERLRLTLGFESSSGPPG